MQALVGLFCFALVLATGTSLECEHCSGLQKDCTGKLKLCSEGQDTCATILTETIIGKVSSFTIIKSCYQASKCHGSNNGNSFIKVNVNIECSSSPAGKIESEGGKALVPGSNELPDNQLLVKLFNRPKSRAAEPPESATDKPESATDKPESATDKPEPTTDKPEPTTDKPEPTTDKPKTSTPKPTTGDAHQTVASFLLALSSLLLMNIVL
ncbi:uncharacterized protein [Pituophis catenifer annectens]|uniref:uncharacterized protein n=1 Tax=Pituophis catenifer annectens TaxID=94852 RepID=UPI0039929100